MLPRRIEGDSHGSCAVDGGWSKQRCIKARPIIDIAYAQKVEEAYFDDLIGSGSLRD